MDLIGTERGASPGAEVRMLVLNGAIVVSIFLGHTAAVPVDEWQTQPLGWDAAADAAADALTVGLTEQSCSLHSVGKEPSCFLEVAFVSSNSMKPTSWSGFVLVWG